MIDKEDQIRDEEERRKKDREAGTESRKKIYKKDGLTEIHDDTGSIKPDAPIDPGDTEDISGVPI